MRPLLGCTMGDPAGVGPDIVLRAVAEHDLPAGVLLLGDPELWRQRATAHHPDLQLTRVRDASEARRLRDGGDAGPWSCNGYTWGVVISTSWPENTDTPLAHRYTSESAVDSQKRSAAMRNITGSFSMPPSWLVKKM
mgnify:CR=1 FL=1